MGGPKQQVGSVSSGPQRIDLGRAKGRESQLFAVTKQTGFTTVQT